VNPRLLASPLFGNVRPIPLPTLAAQAARESGQATEPTALVDTRVDAAQIIDNRVRIGLVTPEQVPTAGATAAPVLTAQGEPTTGLVSPDERGDVFARMRSFLPPPAGATAEATTPSTGADGLVLPSERRGVTPEDASAAAVSMARRLPPQMPVGEVMPRSPQIQAPLKTFVGTKHSAVNQYMAAAEQLLENGQYYQAATQFDLARVVDPRNPLPLVGKSMALLAAGDYVVSASNLIAAVELFSHLGKFRVDLSSFVPDLSVLDHRRLDLEERLEASEDFRLRFLLGYAEYCSGLEDLGLANLDKAVANAPADVVGLRRFVGDLRRQTIRATTRPAE
jgi:hypothetical protein